MYIEGVLVGCKPEIKPQLEPQRARANSDEQEQEQEQREEARAAPPHVCHDVCVAWAAQSRYAMTKSWQPKYPAGPFFEASTAW